MRKRGPICLALLMALALLLLAGCGEMAEAPTDRYETRDNGDGTCTITAYEGSGSEVLIPEEIDGLTVTAIEGTVFAHNQSITSVVVPEGVTDIGTQAFIGCTKLRLVFLPTTLAAFEDYAFSECTALTEIAIPAAVTRIGSGAFESCTSLTSVSIPGTVETVDAWAFKDCESLREVTIEEGVITIGEGAFSGCTDLRSAILPETVDSLGERAFEGCENLIFSVRSGSPAEAYAMENGFGCEAY